MLRKNLLLTTAFVVAGSLSFLVAQAQAENSRPSAALMHNANKRFLCTYGHFDVIDFSEHDASNFSSSGWTHVAVPIVGSGKPVRTLSVVEDGYGHSTLSASVSVGIYANTASGLPGKFIVGGKSRVPGSCATVSIPITPTKLKKGKTYWIEERTPKPHSGWYNDLFWAISPKAERPAYIQTYRDTISSSVHQSSTSPWVQQTSGPYIKLR